MRIWTTLLGLTVPALAWGMQLPPQIQVDRYLVRAERQIEERDLTGAKDSLDGILELREQHAIEVPEDFPLMYARISLGLELYADAIEHATQYLTMVGREGDHYREALELLDRTETAMDEAAAARRRAVERREITDAMEFIRIPAGEFLMGSENPATRGFQRPVTRVRISRSFDLGKYEVTQAEWVAAMGNNPSYFRGCGPSCPVDSVSWFDVQEFIARLNALYGGERYRLPTEAEWEHAARAGTTGDYYGDLSAIAWCGPDDPENPRPVGQKQPNAWGLHDMLGNVSEWVQDWIDDYPGGQVMDYLRDRRSARYPRPERVGRGGGHVNQSCRVSDRSEMSPDQPLWDRGFRLVRVQ